MTINFRRHISSLADFFSANYSKVSKKTKAVYQLQQVSEKSSWKVNETRHDMRREWKIKPLNVVDTHAPLRTKRIRSKRSQWITSELKKRMHERDIRKLKAIGSKNPQDWAEFKRPRNKLTVISRLHRNLITNNHLLNRKMTLDAPGKL